MRLQIIIIITHPRISHILSIWRFKWCKTGKRLLLPVRLPSKDAVSSRSTDSPLSSSSLNRFAWRPSSLFLSWDRRNFPTLTSAFVSRGEVSLHRFTPFVQLLQSLLWLIMPSTLMRAVRMNWGRLCWTMIVTFLLVILVDVNPRNMVDAVPVLASRSPIVNHFWNESY